MNSHSHDYAMANHRHAMQVLGARAKKVLNSVTSPLQLRAAERFADLALKRINDPFMREKLTLQMTALRERFAVESYYCEIR